MIGIRTDANEEIAMGHVMRCLSIAIPLREMGEDVIFILSDAYTKDFILDAGFPCEILNNDYTKKNQELPQMAGICEHYELRGILVDSYEVNPMYFAYLHRLLPTAYIDDLNRYCFDVDILINYSLGISEEEYDDWECEDTEFLLGNSYTPLRPEFSGGIREITETVEDIFITTGGTDPYNMIFRLLDLLADSPLAACRKHIVLGKFYSETEALQLRAKKDTTLHIYQNIPNIREIMMSCDLAVSAGGTTLYELAACGIPTVAFTMADNQQYGSACLAETGALICVGDIRGIEDAAARDIVTALVSLAENPSKRRELASASHRLIDGLGARRIAEILCARFP